MITSSLIGSPSISVWHQTRHHVVGGVGTLLRDQLGAGDGELERGEDAGVVVIAGAAAERDRLGGRALDVLPPVEAEPQERAIIIAGNGAANASIASTYPASSAPSISSVTTARISSSCDATAWGVNRRATRRRCAWCTGSSCPIIERSSCSWAGAAGRSCGWSTAACPSTTTMSW